jgi:hypothetical protein
MNAMFRGTMAHRDHEEGEPACTISNRVASTDSVAVEGRSQMVYILDTQVVSLELSITPLDNVLFPAPASLAADDADDDLVVYARPDAAAIERLGLSEGDNPWRHLGVPDSVARAKFERNAAVSANLAQQRQEKCASSSSSSLSSVRSTTSSASVKKRPIPKESVDSRSTSTSSASSKKSSSVPTGAGPKEPAKLQDRVASDVATLPDLETDTAPDIGASTPSAQIARTNSYSKLMEIFHDDLIHLLDDEDRPGARPDGDEELPGMAIATDDGYINHKRPKIGR